MTEFGNSVKSLRFTLVPPADVATSGNVALVFNVIPVTGRIAGYEIGSPSFSTATGSLYVFSSGNTLNSNRLVFQFNGLPQARDYFEIVQYSRLDTNGAEIS